MYSKKVIAQPVGWKALAEKERIYMNAENDRLLYVATTRAKQLLIVSQYPNRPAIDPWSSLKDSLAQQLELEVREMLPVRREMLQEAPDLHAAASQWQNWLPNPHYRPIEKPT